MEFFKRAFPINARNHIESQLWKRKDLALFNLNEDIFQYSKGRSLDNFPLQMKLYPVSTDSKIMRVISLHNIWLRFFSKNLRNDV